MQEEHPTFEIEAINPDSLTLRKRVGIWNFKLKPGELSQAARDALEQRQRLDWPVLGFAVMDRRGERGMKLHEVRL